MKRLIIITSLLLATLLNACTQTTTDNAVQNINAIDLNEKLKSGDELQLLDVRTPDEWLEGTIARAILINYHSNDFKEKIKALNKEQPIVVYCATGGRSMKASKIIVEAGYQKVYNLDGGISEWKQKNYPVTK